VERLGIVGLPNSGKSSLFNAVTEASVAVAPHPFTTTETNVGVAQVPDHRLLALSEMSKSKKTVHTTVEMVDVAGLAAGSSAGEGLGNRFLAGLREVDALCFVLRAFEDANVTGGNDPLEDLGVLELELVLADTDSAEWFVVPTTSIPCTPTATSGWGTPAYRRIGRTSSPAKRRCERT
jgi:ribosome-binding ATPase YchF (GTP1/OBG family)